MIKASRLSVGISVLLLLLFFGFSSLRTAYAATNLISNPSVETPNPTNANQPQSWATDLWGTTKATFTYPTTGHTGEIDFGCR